MERPTSFPGSLFSASVVVEKRDPGNEVVERRGNRLGNGMQRSGWPNLEVNYFPLATDCCENAL